MSWFRQILYRPRHRFEPRHRYRFSSAEFVEEYQRERGWTE